MEKRLYHLPVFLLYLILAIVLTWPLVARIATHLPMGENDLWQNYWNFWWWKTALWEKHTTPYFTDMIFHIPPPPHGAHLGCHTHSPANMLSTLPVNILFGEAAALNLALLAGFVLAGFGTYLLSREYTTGRGAPFLAGLVFAYFPQHVEQSLEHLNLASYYGIPFFLWALVRMVRRGNSVWWMLTGFFFTFNALTSWHNGLLALSLGAALGVYESWKSPRGPWRILLDLAKAAAICGILIAPFLWPLFQDATAERAVLFKRYVPKSIDPIFLLIPHSSHPLWGKAFSKIYDQFRSYPSVGFLGYLGLVTMSLAAAAFLIPRRRASGPPEVVEGTGGIPGGSRWVWGGLAVFFLLLSFGETLRIANVEIPWIPLPLRWLGSVPLFGLVRVPNRFLVPVALSVAVLASMGAGSIACFLPRRRRALFFWGIAGLLILDYLWIPYPTREVPRPQWIEKLKDLPEGLAVLDIPSGHRARGANDMFLQTLHGRPIASGYVASDLRKVRETMERFPVLFRVFQLHPPEQGFSDTSPSLSEAIRALDVGIVVVHLDRTVERIRREREKAREEFPQDLYRMRLYNPEKGIRASQLAQFQRELHENFGPPIHVSPGEVEIYVVSPVR